MDNEELVENEWYVVRHSGEIPEIALHSSFYYLTQDKNGPKLSLNKDQECMLKKAALDRFREIVLRDISPENRDKTIYRGLKRTIANWDRFTAFCSRQNLSPDTLKKEVRIQLLSFLATDGVKITSCECNSEVNCSLQELQNFAMKLDVEIDALPKELGCGCQLQQGI